MQIEHERVRREAMPALQIARRILDAPSAWTAHDNHFMRAQVAQAQPPIPALVILTHENKIRTRAAGVHPFFARTTRRPGDGIAAAQLTVDLKVEERKIAFAFLRLQPGPNDTNLAGP